MTKEDLGRKGQNLVFTDETVLRDSAEYWDRIAKPLCGLGLYEKTISRIAAIRGTLVPSLEKKTLVLFFSDNGIAEENVSQSTQDVTRKVAVSTAKGRSSACLMARKANVDVVSVDVGMKGDTVPSFIDKRIREGSRNFLKEKAMTEEEMMKAIEAGFDVTQSLIQGGTDVILLGEMGVANTTTATAVSCALLGLDPLSVTGRGSGLSDGLLDHKARVIREALKKYGFNSKSDAMDVLCAVGGYDIAAMVGSIICCACHHVPVVLDGLITLCAALVSQRLFPGIEACMIASHRPREAAGKAVLENLGLEAPLDASLALGEGTGALLLMPQLDMALELYRSGASFGDIGMPSYEKY